MKRKVSVQLELEDAPNWLSHVELTRDDEDHIVIEVIRTNGTSCGVHRIGTVAFNNMADLLLTATE